MLGMFECKNLKIQPPGVADFLKTKVLDGQIILHTSISLQGRVLWIKKRFSSKGYIDVSDGFC